MVFAQIQKHETIIQPTQALRYCTLKLVPGQIYFLQGREVAKGLWNYSSEVVFSQVYDLEW